MTANTLKAQHITRNSAQYPVTHREEHQVRCFSLVFHLGKELALRNSG